METGKRGNDVVSPKTLPLVCGINYRKECHGSEFLPKEWGVVCISGTSTLGTCPWKTEPLKHLALEIKRLMLRGLKRLCGSDILFLRGESCIDSFVPGLITKATIWEVTWSVWGRFFASLKASARGAETSWNFLWKWRCWREHSPSPLLEEAGAYI